MEEQNITNINDEQAKLEKHNKSLNRIFGVLLATAIILGLILIYEIVLLFI